MNIPDKFPDGTRLRVAVENWEPHVRVFENESSLSITGPMALLLDTLSEKLNFNYKLYRPPDGSWGAPNQFDEWNGMIGMVKRNEVDIALGPFILSQIRAEAVQYSSIFLIDYFRVFLARESPKAQPLAFVKPFSTTVWLTILFSFCVSACVFALVKRSNPIRRRWLTISWPRIWGESIFEVFGLFVNQELPYRVSGGTFRILLLSICILDLVVVKFYSGALTSALAVKISHTKFSGLQDIFGDDGYQILIERSTAITAAMEVAQSGLLAEMKDKEDEGIISQVSVATLFEAARNDVPEDELALFVEETTCYKLTSDFFSETGQCQYYVGDQRLFPSLFGIIAQKHSPIMPVINKVIARIIEGNFYTRWLQDEIPNATTCLDKKSFKVLKSEAYDLVSLWVSFGLLHLGLFVAFITYLCEVGAFKFLARRKTSVIHRFNHHTTIHSAKWQDFNTTKSTKTGRNVTPKMSYRNGDRKLFW